MKNALRRWLIDRSKELSRQGLYQFLNGAFGTIAPGAAVLSVGAGGPVNALLKEYGRSIGFTIQSLDIDPERQPDIVGDICTIPFKNQFDVVVMSEVLEHVHAPQQALDNVHSTLREGGVLVLTTPFIFPLHDRPHDFYRYTRYGLAHLLRSFENVSIEARNGYFATIDVLWVRLWREQSRRAQLMAYLMIPLVYFVKRPFSSLLDRIIQADGLTSGYVVVANKRGKEGYQYTPN